VVFRTRATGYELARIRIPDRRHRYTDRSGPDCNWPTAEPPHRINQIYLEPILHARAGAEPRLRVLYDTCFDRFEQDPDGVTVEATRIDGSPVRLRGRFLIGCEGGRSEVRRAIGARFIGDAVIQRVQSTYFRAPDLLQRITTPRAWMSYLYNPQRQGNLVAIDGRETWLLHNYLLPDEADFDAVDRDRCLRQLLGVGEDFRYEMLNVEDWIGRRLVADRFRDRRVFICGDAAHLWVPYAGYGMNAGIADAMNLSWMLAAHLQGWAPVTVLAGHERERHPITDQVSRFAMKHAQGAIRERTSLPRELEDDGPAGAAARVAVGAAAYALNVQQFACAGLNYGYYYDDSPLIAYDGERAPPYTMHDYTPSTVPGCRTPWFRLADGRGLYDAAGAWYTLLRFDPAAEIDSLTEAARLAGLPLSVLDVAGADAGPEHRHRLLIMRPDQHVAWRGDEVPPDAPALIDRLRGA
ncbi:monooxygenase, partial [bacterium]